MTHKRIILVRYGRSAMNDDLSAYSHVPDNMIEPMDEGREQAWWAGGVV